MAEQTNVYRPDERPDIQAPVEGEWRPGELRAWTQHEDGRRTFDVQYQPTGSNTRTIGTFMDNAIRSDSVDRYRAGMAESEQPTRTRRRNFPGRRGRVAPPRGRQALRHVGTIVARYVQHRRP